MHAGVGNGYFKTNCRRRFESGIFGRNSGDSSSGLGQQSASPFRLFPCMWRVRLRWLGRWTFNPEKWDHHPYALPSLALSFTFG